MIDLVNLTPILLQLVDEVGSVLVDKLDMPTVFNSLV